MNILPQLSVSDIIEIANNVRTAKTGKNVSQSDLVRDQEACSPNDSRIGGLT